MKASRHFRLACVAAAFSFLASPQTEAFELADGAHLARLDAGMVSQAYMARRGAVYHGGVYRGPRGGVYRGGTVYHGGAYGWRGGAYGYRGYGYHGGYWGGWARPGWYAWPAGGAIAAGAAIGVLGAAAAVSYAGAAPGPGLCWYYTTPARTQGFWDACQ